MADARTQYPGSSGEQFLQDLYATRERAATFYRRQVVDALTPRMVEFLGRQTMMIVASVDTEGAPDVSVRFGEPGFVGALDQRTVAWPEMRGNGVFTTLGNLTKTPSAHLMFLDYEHRIGLHVRGEASIVEAADAWAYAGLTEKPRSGRDPERWVVLRVRNSYIHCRKHFPRSDGPIDWGTDDMTAKGGDYFGAKSVPKPWSR
ncbi:MAG TPA: pyridoxamine 5'-phosphate oxidase family protein [Jatrophihabitans sp.]|nr:pyridoxamine 5'-phosphate oxidase family protein [Jatrophihabitans sp.]